MTEYSIKITSPVRNIIHVRRRTILLTVAIALVLSVYLITIGSHAQTNADNGTDILLYRTDDGEWRYYDPHNRIDITLPDEALSHRLSRDGRVAFTKKDENSTELYVFDPQMPDIAPINISQTPAENRYNLDWSPNGRYLAFTIWQGASYYADSLYVWDGETVINITPDISPINISQTSAESYYSRFRWSSDGRYLAFGLKVFHEENGNYADSLYVWDGETVINITPDIAPINVSQDPYAISYKLSWSPDGRYLAFTIWRGASNYADLLFVWDGETVINVAPDNGLDFVREIDVDWSSDGRLAFTIEYHEEEEDTAVPSEIYVWDENITTNLSQNPTVADWGATWSDNGQLAFMSVRDGEEGIYVWDGVSFKDGSPDSDSFIHVTRELQLPEDDNPQYPRPDPIWTDEGFLGFLVIEEVAILSPRRELVFWDVETQEIAVQFRSPEWAGFGGWNRLRNGQLVNYYWGIASGRGAINFEVRDTRGRLLLSDSVGGWAWSPDGYLAFCDLGREDSPGLRVVSILDGQEVQIVAKTSESIDVRWQSGGRTFNCWDG
jgi:Tol biopolymer transport system component